MASNLLKVGYPVVAYDISQDALSRLQQKGAVIASSPKGVSEKARTIVSMVPASAHVKEVYLGSEGVLEAAKSVCGGKVERSLIN